MKKLKIIISVLLVFLLSSCELKVTLKIPKNNLKSTTESTVNLNDNTTNLSSIDIKNVKNQLETLEKNLADTNEKEVILKYLEDFKEKSVLKTSATYFGNESGIFYVFPVVQLPNDYDPRTRPWYTGAKENGEYVSDAYIDFSTNNQMLSVSKAIYKDKELIGVVGIDLIVEKKPTDK